MPKVLRIGAVVLGIVGVLLCAVAIGFGWWAAARTVTRTERVAERLDIGLSEFDAPLERVELRVHAIRADLDRIRSEAEAIAAENPELPRARAAIDLLLARLVSSFERADALADSLRSQAAGLRATADIVDQFNDDAAVSVPVRSAADKIDRAAAALDGLRGQIQELKVAKAVELTRGVVALAAKALAGSELLAEGLTSARAAIAAARTQTAELKDSLISWTYIAASASTVFWLWGGLGQLCLIAWGRRTLILR